MTEEEKKARRRERDRARYHRNKDRLANDEERKAKMKARRLAREAADPDHNAKHWAKRKAREAANPDKYAETRQRLPSQGRPLREGPLAGLQLKEVMTLEPQLRDGEVRPRHGIEHVCAEPRAPIVDEVHFNLLRRAKFVRKTCGVRQLIQHLHEEHLGGAKCVKHAMFELGGREAERAKPLRSNEGSGSWR